MNLDVTKSWVSTSLTHERILTCCAFSPCGEFLVAGGQEENVQRWELSGGKKTSLAAHRSWIGALAFQAQPKRLFTADLHGTVHAWAYDAEDPKPLWSLPEAHQGWIRALAVTSDGRLLSAGNDRVIRLWSAVDGKPLGEYSGHEHYIFSLAVNPDGTSLASGDLLGNIRHWDLRTGKAVRTLDAKLLHTRGDDFLADVGGVRSLVFDADGKQLAAGGMSDAKSNTFCPGKPAVLVFDWQSGKLTRTLRPKHTSDGPIQGLAFLGDGTLAGHAEHLNGVSSLEFWRPGKDESVNMIKRQSAYCLDVHPDGTKMAAATFKNNGRGGNGRHATREEYITHDGEIAIFSLFEKPKEIP